MTRTNGATIRTVTTTGKTTTIEGRGVYLRPGRLEDYPEWFALRIASRNELAAVEPNWKDENLSLPTYEARLVNEARAIAEGRGFPFLIFRHDGVMIGGLTLGPIVRKVSMLGIWIGKPFVNRGYAIHAVEAAMNFGFADLGLERIDATVLPENLGSIRALEHFGFERYANEVTQMVAGKPREHQVYAAMRPR